jgi:hypothetical protein
LCLEVVALDHDPVRRRLPFNLHEAEHRPAGLLDDPEGERGRVVLLRNAMLLEVAVEVGQVERGFII